MCNLYKLRRSAAEVASTFNARVEIPFNAAEEVLPGYPGMVVRSGGNSRVLQSMGWGFPLHLKTMKPESKPKPVNNVRDLSKGMWVAWRESHNGTA